MRPVLPALWAGLRTGWAYLNGDLAYAGYCRHVHAAHPGQVPVDRQAFYLQRLQQRFHGVNRCC